MVLPKRNPPRSTKGGIRCLVWIWTSLYTGKFNLFFILMVVLTILLQGVWKFNDKCRNFPRTVSLYKSIVCNAILLLIGYISFTETDESIRVENEFTWFPIFEVAKLFGGNLSDNYSRPCHAQGWTRWGPGFYYSIPYHTRVSLLIICTFG